MTEAAGSGAQLRLLGDELLSPKIPRALEVLGYRTSHVGHSDHGAPVRGSTDAQIIAYAQLTSQIIVTSNHDMMLLCEEAGQRFVWVDPFGKQLSRAEQVLVVFRQIDSWAEILSDGTSCVRSQRTKCSSISATEAVRLVGQRMRDLQRHRRSSSKAVRSDTDGLFS